MKNSRVLVLIPARYASTRFDGKPLATILGKSMIQRVYENCATSGFNVAVVTDDDRIEEHVRSFSGQLFRVDDDVSSGTERIELAYSRNFSEGDLDLVINVQGDEPLLTGDELKRLAEFHLKSDFDIATIVKRKSDFRGEFLNPDRVKATFSPKDGRCHYFSRAPIPYSRSGSTNGDWFLHIGVYSYLPKSLETFCKAEHSYYEKMECLEQLRALDAGMSIGAIETRLNLIGVDSPEDIHIVEGVINGKKTD